MLRIDLTSFLVQFHHLIVPSGTSGSSFLTNHTIVILYYKIYILISFEHVFSSLVNISIFTIGKIRSGYRLFFVT